MRHSRFPHCAALCLLFTAALAAPATADEAATDPPPPERPWKGSLGLAYLATSGNAETTTLGFDAKAERLPRPWGFELTASYQRAEQNGTRTAERRFLGGRAKRALAEGFELFAGASAEEDEFAGLDRRTLLEVGVTYVAFTGPRHTVAVDGGLTWTDEDRVAPVEDAAFLGALAGLTHTWLISDTASWRTRLVAYPNLEDSDDWRAQAETALQAALGARLAVQLSYEVRYRNEPIGGADDTDTTAKASLVVTL